MGYLRHPSPPRIGGYTQCNLSYLGTTRPDPGRFSIHRGTEVIDQQFLMWTTIVGFFAPIAIAFVQQEPWSQILRATVMFLMCIIIGLGNCYFQGKLHLE